MTEKQFRRKFKEMVSGDLQTFINREMEKHLKSGAIDLSAFEDNYYLPKIVLSAVLQDAGHQYEPFDREGRKQVSNLRNF